MKRATVMIKCSGCVDSKFPVDIPKPTYFRPVVVKTACPACQSHHVLRFSKLSRYDGQRLAPNQIIVHLVRLEISQAAKEAQKRGQDVSEAKVDEQKV
jgi:hypothetical protein